MVEMADAHKEMEMLIDYIHMASWIEVVYEVSNYWMGSNWQVVENITESWLVEVHESYRQLTLFHLVLRPEEIQIHVPFEACHAKFHRCDR